MTAVMNAALFNLWYLDQSQDKENYKIQMALTNESLRWSTISVDEQYFDLQFYAIHQVFLKFNL